VITTENQIGLMRWICDRIGYMPSPFFRAIGSLSHIDGHLRGVVGYDSYNGASVVMHMAGEPGWIDKAILHAAFDYPFNTMGCSQVLAFVPSGNDTAQDIDTRLGFETVVELEGAHPDGSLIVMRMKRDDCKWISPHRTH
jgi:hypothetical protein